MGVTHTITEHIRTKQLIWYDHVQRMAEERIPKQILKWNPQGREKRGRQGKVGERASMETLEPEVWRTIDEWTETDGDWVFGRRRRTL